MGGPKQTLLVALGGNALIRKGQTGTIAQQFENLHLPLHQIAHLAGRFRIVITHGNGPQVGNLLLQQESCPDLPRIPLEILVAQTQGQIGYMIEATLDRELAALRPAGNNRRAITVLTYVVVDDTDPAFQNPTKPIGPFFTAAQAAHLPYPTVKTAKGFRRVVVSPRPRTIVKRREIARLIEKGFIVICCGGGGIPVLREEGGGLRGVEAVIDKDLASARLAVETEVDKFVIATDVPGAILAFGTPGERLLQRLTLSEAEALLREGHFPQGSMGPKIEACALFVRHRRKPACITELARIEEAVAGTTGTLIVPDD